MSKLNIEQKNYIKSLDSKEDRKEVKKVFKKCNKEKEIIDSVKVLRKFFKSISPK